MGYAQASMHAGEFTRAVLPWLVAPGFYRQPGQVEGLIQFAERNPWPQDAEAFARQAAAATEHDTRDRVRSDSGSCLVIVRRARRAQSAAGGNRAGGTAADAELVVMPGVGHMPHVEDQMRFRQEIERFLEHHDA